jgi:hypothetical protein
MSCLLVTAAAAVMVVYESLCFDSMVGKAGQPCNSRIEATESITVSVCVCVGGWVWVCVRARACVRARVRVCVCVPLCVSE